MYIRTFKRQMHRDYKWVEVLKPVYIPGACYPLPPADHDGQVFEVADPDAADKLAARFTQEWAADRARLEQLRSAWKRQGPAIRLPVRLGLAR